MQLTIKLKGFVKKITAINNYSYEVAREKGYYHAAVMWCRADFEGKEVKHTNSSIAQILERLQKNPDEDVSEVLPRTAMVKLTCKTTKVSFLAVSWHGQYVKEKEIPNYKEWEKTKLKALYGLIRFLREVWVL